MIDWNEHCADFAAAHSKATTGRDVGRKLGKPPRSPREAAALMKKLKVRTLKGAVTKLLGKPVKPAFAMRGDIVLVPSAAGRADNSAHKAGQIMALGICRGDLIECADNMLPISRAVCAWKV